MKQNHLTCAWVMSGLLIGTQIVTAITADNPYLTAVTGRNLFALKPPPDPASLIPVVQLPPLPDIKLAGITTLMGSPRAILRAPRAAKPPEPPKEISLYLAPGGPAEEGVKVLEINVAAGTVKIDNNGTVQDLDIAKNAPKAAPGPAPAAGLPAPPPSGGVMPAPPSIPVAPALTSFNRPMRSGSGTVVGGGPGQIAEATPEQVPAEVAAINYATWVIRDEAKVKAGLMPPYPPSELTEALGQEGQQGSGGPPVPK